MRTLEVFFDYACPYCLKGHENLLSLSPNQTQIEIKWHPCEAHPRPERYGLHSDICARGFYFALEHGADIMEYHRRMYNAALKERVNIEDLSVIAKKLEGLLDTDKFYKVLQGGAYVKELTDNNRMVWETYAFPAVPSYFMNGKTLAAIENIGVTKDRLADFLR